MNHYATLEVPNTADDVAIKRAYRRKAARAHPDKGGRAADMAALNKAYAVLGDPQRRLQYDQSGSDAEAKPIDIEARDVLMHCFAQMLEGAELNYVEQARKIIRGELGKIEFNLANTRTKQADFKRRREKVKSKGRENFFHMLIDQQIAGMDNGIRNGEKGIAVMKRALEILEDYEGETPPVTTLFFSGTSSATGGW